MGGQVPEPLSHILFVITHLLPHYTEQHRRVMIHSKLYTNTETLAAAGDIIIFLSAVLELKTGQLFKWGNYVSLTQREKTGVPALRLMMDVLSGAGLVAH